MGLFNYTPDIRKMSGINYGNFKRIPVEYQLPRRPVTGTMYQARKRKFDFEMNASEAARYLGVTRMTMCRWLQGQFLKIGPYKLPALIPPHTIRRVPRVTGKPGKQTKVIIQRYELMEWVHKYRVHVLVRRRRNEIRNGPGVGWRKIRTAY